MLNKYQDEVEVNSYSDLQQALCYCIHAKNACSLIGPGQTYPTSRIIERGQSSFVTFVS